MTDDLAKVLDEIELRFRQSVVTPDPLRDIASRMVVVARAADALFKAREWAEGAQCDCEWCTPWYALRAALDALRASGR